MKVFSLRRPKLKQNQTLQRNKHLSLGALEMMKTMSIAVCQIGVFIVHWAVCCMWVTFMFAFFVARVRPASSQPCWTCVLWAVQIGSLEGTSAFKLRETRQRPHCNIYPLQALGKPIKETGVAHVLHVKGSVTCSSRTLEKNENTSDQMFNLELGLKGVLVT